MKSPRLVRSDKVVNVLFSFENNLVVTKNRIAYFDPVLNRKLSFH